MADFTDGRFVMSWVDAAGARDPIALTSQVKYLRGRLKNTGFDAGLVLLVVADEELDAAVELVQAALDTTRRPATGEDAP